MTPPNLTRYEWQAIAALTQQAIEVGRVAPSDLQTHASRKLIEWCEEESRPKKKHRKDRWWLSRSGAG